jgi:membrane-associated phospholipid phosphatase
MYYITNTLKKIQYNISHVNPRKSYKIQVISVALFLFIGILRLYTNIFNLIDIDYTVEIPYIWDILYIFIYGTIFFGPHLYWWGHKKEGIVLAALLTGAGFAGLLSKEVFRLPRPPYSTEPGYGYPSFHAQVSVIGWGYLKKYGKCALIMPVLTGISRVACGDHYLTDVIGGSLLGIGSLYCFPYLYNIRVPESVWKRWIIVIISSVAVYIIGYNVEHIPLVLGLLMGFFLGCSAIKKFWTPVSHFRGIIASVLGISISITFLLSVVVLPEVISAILAGLWMSVCPLLFVRINLLCYTDSPPIATQNRTM